MLERSISRRCSFKRRTRCDVLFVAAYTARLADAPGLQPSQVARTVALSAAAPLAHALLIASRHVWAGGIRDTSPRGSPATIIALGSRTFESHGRPAVADTTRIHGLQTGEPLLVRQTRENRGRGTQVAGLLERTEREPSGGGCLHRGQRWRNGEVKRFTSRSQKGC